MVVLVSVSFFEEGGVWRLGRRTMFMNVGTPIYWVHMSKEKRTRDCSALILKESFAESMRYTREVMSRKVGAPGLILWSNKGGA